MHLYEERGPAFVEDLRGMFALALWDARRRRLVLARDPFGIKPLVYALDGRRLAFASELKALLALPRLPARHRPRRARGVPRAQRGPRAARRSSRRCASCPPGHLLVAEHERRARSSATRDRGRRRWPSLRREPLPALAAEVRERLADSVRAHLAADVPVGVLLSGGVDSGLVTALAEHAAADVHRRLRREDFDELAGCARGRRRYGTEHHELRLGPEAVHELPGVAATTTSRAATRPRSRTGCSPGSRRVTSRRC